jgi:hypothetical protein
MPIRRALPMPANLPQATTVPLAGATWPARLCAAAALLMAQPAAAAPLSAELAGRAEARCAAPVREIYGSTESGQLASRRTIDGARWHA